MSEIDNLYLREENKLIQFHLTILLSELTYLNYIFSNKKYNNISGKDIFDLVFKNFKFNENQKKSIIKNSMKLINVKYNIKLKDNLIDQFYNLDL